MKPFDLKAAIAGEKLQTRDGREVTEFHFFETATDDEKWPISAVVSGKIFSFDKRGVHWNDGPTSDLDLFMVTQKEEGWINVWMQKVGSINHSCVSHPSKEVAFKVRMEDIKYLGDPVKIWEEEV